MPEKPAYSIFRIIMMTKAAGFHKWQYLFNKLHGLISQQAKYYCLVGCYTVLGLGLQFQTFQIIVVPSSTGSRVPRREEERFSI
jgi:hypothetical protein